MGVYCTVTTTYPELMTMKHHPSVARRLSPSVHPLLLCCLPAISWCLLAAAAADVVPPAGYLPGCKPKCGDVDIPYPFGIIGDHRCSIPSGGFEVNCTSVDGTERPLIGPFEVTKISVPDAKAWMKMNISWHCYHYHDEWWYRFTRTPFRFSYEDNKIFVMGCNTLAYMRSQPVSD